MQAFIESYSINSRPTCDCHSSKFRDPNHNHIVTGDLNIISHPGLRLLFTLGANFGTIIGGLSPRRIRGGSDRMAIPMAELFRRGLRLGPPGSEQVRGGRRRSPPNSISPRNKKFRRGFRRGLGGLPRNKFVPPRIRSDPRRIGGTSAGGMH